MRRKIGGLIILCLFCSKSFSQDSAIANIILIGDAGQLTNGKHPVTNAVKRNIPLNAKTTIVFLGDNLYRYGLPENTVADYDIKKAALDSQIHVADGTDAKVYFVPGNHDWESGGSKGYLAIRRAQSYIDSFRNENVKMFPRDACPGPVAQKINDDIILIMLDSQWWIQPDSKKGDDNSCTCKTRAAVIASFKEMLEQYKNKMVLIAFHHPLISYGPHGGYFTLKQHIFPLSDLEHPIYIPLPLLGSLYCLIRMNIGISQDQSSRHYREMIREIETAASGYNNIIFAAGHEHTLQYIEANNHYYIVSGSGSKHSRVHKGAYSLFASGKNGFTQLQVYRNGKINVQFYEENNGNIVSLFNREILLKK